MYALSLSIPTVGVDDTVCLNHTRASLHCHLFQLMEDAYMYMYFGEGLPHPADAINRVPTHCPSLRSDSLMCPASLVTIHHRALQEIARICDVSSECSGGDCRWAAKVNFSGWIAHTACKVAVHRR